MAQPPNSAPLCLPLFIYDDGHEDRLNVTVEEKMYIIVNGQRSAVLCSGWFYAKDLVTKEDGNTKRDHAKFKGVHSWEEAVTWLYENHALAGPHTCLSTFTSERSGLVGRQLTILSAFAPSTTLSTPTRASQLQSAPPSPHTPRGRGRGRGRALHIPPDVANSFTPTPSTPSTLFQATASSSSTPSWTTRTREASPSPVSSTSTSSSISRSSTSVPLSRRFEWFVVFSTSQEGPETFDNITAAKKYMNARRAEGCKVRMSMGNDVETIINAWNGFQDV